jgi:hypothetical protein
MSENHDGPALLAPEDKTRWLQELRADMAETVNGVLLRGSRPVPVGNAGAGGGLRPTNSPGVLMGCAARNLGAAALQVTVRDVAGQVVAILDLGIGAAGQIWFGPGGVNIPDGGLYLDPGAGTFEGVVYLRGSD